MFHRFHTGTWQRRASGRVPTRFIALRERDHCEWPTSCEGDNHVQWLCSEFVPFLLLFDCQEAFHCCLVVTCSNRINMISIQCHRVGEWWSGKPEFEHVSDPAGVYIPFKLLKHAPSKRPNWPMPMHLTMAPFGESGLINHTHKNNKQREGGGEMAD